ncbi:MAG TPA: tetratricopeptide repeat protein [Gemmatimonadaceae bacterium]|jgi:tetratricopeptide (TPR) repeat protein|nr:tetratricopeptide repeat protein [Gemmatimonadaceae bacterium]
MIRHQVYFDTLGSMTEDSASWRSTFAGLSILRLVDTYADAGSPSNPGGWAQLHSVQAAVEAIGEGNPVRGVLSAVFDAVTRQGAVDDVVSNALVAYGRALDYEASWGLATDVFLTVARLTRPEKNARLAVEAHVAAGGAARRNGDWDTSARAYSQAAFIADTLGDRPGVLTVQVGIANTYLAKGNLPQAETILDDVIVQARDQDYPEIQGMALHSRASIAQRRGEHAECVKLGYEALNLSTKPAARDAVLADIAAGLSELGMIDAARDAHLILANTSQMEWVRWQATINLMELAGREGKEDAFESYASQLSGMKLSPAHKAYFLLFRGEGLAAFGHHGDAEENLRAAVSFATNNQLHQIAFEADAALSALHASQNEARREKASRGRVTWSDDLSHVVTGLSHLREAAFAAPAK